MNKVHSFQCKNVRNSCSGHSGVWKHKTIAYELFLLKEGCWGFAVTWKKKKSRKKNVGKVHGNGSRIKEHCLDSTEITLCLCKHKITLRIFIGFGETIISWIIEETGCSFPVLNHCFKKPSLWSLLWFRVFWWSITDQTKTLTWLLKGIFLLGWAFLMNSPAPYNGATSAYDWAGWII